MRKRGSAVVSLLVAGLVLAGLAVTDSSSAAPKTTTPTTGGASAAAPHHGQLLKALHHAKELLEKADHDYDGHRAKAVHLLTQAIHKLKPHPVAPASAPQPTAGAGQQPGVPKTPATSQEPKMVQAESDRHLKEAAEILGKVQPHVQEHHQEAAALLTTAIQEIHTALSIN
jgi:hypothetical protein